MELKYIPWPGWEMVREIGSGTFGTVYEIKHDLITEEEHAALKVLSVPQNESEIKSMRSEGLKADEITQTVKDQAGRILREYKNLSELQGAPNIVRCNAVHHEMHKDGIGVDVYILMELLIPLLDKADELLQTEAQIIDFAIDMCHALIACEEKKILHRDIKPENIFVSKEGVYKLGDFGVARNLDHTTYGTKGMGTPSYMAPEVANGGAYNKQADIYSLGIVLYWLLNKRRTPFLPLPPKGIRVSDREEALTRRCSGEPIPAPVNGSKELKRIVLKACAFDLKDRYQSAADLLVDLSALAGVQPTVVSPMPDTREDGSDTNADGIEEEAICGPVFDEVSEDQNTDETVGPVFIPSTENKSEDQERTVGPMFTPKDKPQPPKKKKRVWPIVVVAMLAVIIGSLFWPVYGEWTEWSEELPEELEYCKVETLQQYRAKIKYPTTYCEPQTESSDVEFVKKWDEWSEYSEWGDWQTEEIQANDQCEVQQEVRYRSREVKIEEKYTDWGKWSGWSSTAATQSDTVEAQTRTVYYYNAYRYICPCGTSLSGVSLTMLAHARKFHGDDERLMPLRQYLVGEDVSLSEALAGANFRYESTSLTGVNQKLSVDTSSSPYTIGGDWYTNSAEPSMTEKQYRVRTRESKKVEEFSPWTEYTTEILKADDDTQVESQVFYRARTRELLTNYQYNVWGKWSEWSFSPEEESEEKRIETRQVYRYANRHCLWEKLLGIVK